MRMSSSTLIFSPSSQSHQSQRRIFLSREKAKKCLSAVIGRNPPEEKKRKGKVAPPWLRWERWERWERKGSRDKSIKTELWARTAAFFSSIKNKCKCLTAGFGRRRQEAALLTACLPLSLAVISCQPHPLATAALPLLALRCLARLHSGARAAAPHGAVAAVVDENVVISQNAIGIRRSVYQMGRRRQTVLGHFFPFPLSLALSSSSPLPPPSLLFEHDANANLMVVVQCGSCGIWLQG